MHIRCIIMQAFLFGIFEYKVTLDNRGNLVYIDLRILFEKGRYGNSSGFIEWGCGVYYY